MNDVIWKYELPLKNEFVLNLPKKHSILDVQWQHGKWQMWVRHELTDNPIEPVTFHLAGTGVELPDVAPKRLEHVATLQQYDGHIVVHLFKVAPDYTFPILEVRDIP